MYSVPPKELQLGISVLGGSGVGGGNGSNPTNLQHTPAPTHAPPPPSSGLLTPQQVIDFLQLCYHVSKVDSELKRLAVILKHKISNYFQPPASFTHPSSHVAPPPGGDLTGGLGRLGNPPLLEGVPPPPPSQVARPT